MKQIKIFYCDGEVEIKINQWIKDNNVDVLQIETLANEFLVILYETKEMNKLKDDDFFPYGNGKF